MNITRAQAQAQLTAPGAPFEIEEVLLGGVPTRVWKQAPGTLVDILRTSRDYRDRAFLVYEDERLSFADHFVAAARFAHVLRDRFGVIPGDRVAVAMRNVPEWSVAFWGAVAAGAVVVPLNGWWGGEELAYGLADSGSRVAVVDAERAARLAEYWPALDSVSSVIAVRTPVGEAVAGAGIRGRRWDEVFEGVDHLELPEIPIAPDDDATIFYTSGTTGRSKGALGTHRNICTNPMSQAYDNSLVALCEGRPPAPGSAVVHLVSVPFFHATGCHSMLVGSVAAGGTLVVMPSWDPGQALELIQRERVTTFGGVPSMVMQVLDHPDFERWDTSSVSSVAYGGAPTPPELVRRITAKFPMAMPRVGYGLTETSSIATMNAGVDYVAKPDSVGPPVPVVDVMVADHSGAELRIGEIGELLIKGPNVVKGYWHKPDATAETFAGGWLHSGDVARIDEDGFVFIVDRAKDMLIRGGEKVYCVEIEAVLYEHPAVADAAVIGIPHDVLGEEVGAVIQVRPGVPVNEAVLQDLVASHLAGFKVPVRIWLVTEPLPRNQGGQILKRRLRSEILEA